MRKIKALRVVTALLIAVGSIGLLVDRGSNVHAANGGPTVTIGGPLPLPVVVSNTLQRTLVRDGQFFDITQPEEAPFEPAVEFHVPAGVVLTDVHATLSVPESLPNSAALFVADGSKTLVYQIVNNTTFNAGVDLQSGIMSTGRLTVQLSCYNIAGNHCQGAVMWSGYTTP